MDFFQSPPELENQYTSDATLRAYLAWRMPPEVLADVEPGLERIGALAAGAWQELARTATEPVHVPFDPWGNRVDHIEVGASWRAYERIAAEEGIVAIGYERAHGAWSRLHQFARLYLFAPSSAVFSCPLAMTDGAARALELYGDDELKRGAFARLTSRDPERFWTSGQWMTERTGGSDVSGTSTVARHVEGDHFRLHGTKWFTSATTSQMALTLARPEGAPEGSRGLELFYLELRDAAGRLQGIQIQRLKEKLGTKILPTAELVLDGTPARRVGEPGHGVRKMSSLFNITRMYNATCAIAGVRRGYALATDYARRRIAFGRPLAEQPLHVETLADMALELEAGFHLTFRLLELLGKDETGQASLEESAVLRMLTPMAKLFTGKQAVACASETLECFGGAGYVEDTGLPSLLRDAQVLAIWEGTTNVLSLDTLRAIQHDRAFEPFLADLEERLGRIRAPELADTVARVRAASGAIRVWLPRFVEQGREAVETGARGFALSLGRTYAASLLAEHAAHAIATGRADARLRLAIAERWAARPLTALTEPDAGHRAVSAALALGEALPTERQRAAG